MSEPMSMTWSLSRANADEAVLEVYDSPVPFARTPQDLANELAALKIPRVLVNINSAAGDAAEGLDIYGVLRKWGGQTRTYTTFAAGGAAVVVLAAPKDMRLIAPDGVIFCQQPHVSRVGDLTEITRSIRAATASVAGVFTEQVGWSLEAWDEAMSRLMWWTGQLAVDDGLVGEVATAEEAKRTDRPVKTAQPDARAVPEQRRGVRKQLAKVGQVIEEALVEKAEAEAVTPT